jgi:hypothetical protein
MNLTTIAPNILDRLEDVNIDYWITKHDIRTENGAPLNFHNYRFLETVYADNSPFICCSKAAQIGFTTYEILKSLFEARNENIDIIYVLPTSDDVKQFSGGKTNRIIANNPVLQKWTEDKDSVEQKKVGKATIYYRGSWTERVALMISASKLIVDEYDRCKPSVIEQYDSRLQAITNPRKAFFSNPSIPDFGISKLYAESDQKKWHINHSCGSQFVMDEGCINYNQKIYECPSCHKEITDDERRLGEWIATSEGKWSGYWIPLWITPWTSAAKIAEYKKEKTPEYFANFVAGLPYLGGGDTVLASTIIGCLKNEVNDHGDRIIIGVDTGLPIHIVCANKQGYFYYDTLTPPNAQKSPYDELEALMRRWPKSVVISDQGGDLIGIRALQAKYPGRVFLCWYRRDKKGSEIIKWGEGDEYGSVTVDRNRLIQLFIDEMQDKRVVFNGTESEWQEYIVHWLNIYRVWEENALGIKEFKWERQGDDHWVHASAYCRVGLDRFSESMAKIVDTQGVWGKLPRGFVADNPVDENQGSVILTGDKADF